MIEERCFELPYVNQDRPEPGRQCMPYLDGRVDRPAQHLGHIGDDAIEVCRDRVEALLAGKGEKRFGELSPAGCTMLSGMH